MDVSVRIVVSANGTTTMVEQETCVVSEGGHGSFMDHRQPKLTSRERIRLIISGVRAGT